MAPTPGDPEPSVLPGSVLVIGACGQLGLELVAALRQRYEPHLVVAADVRPPKNPDLLVGGPFEDSKRLVVIRDSRMRVFAVHEPVPDPEKSEI